MNTRIRFPNVVALIATLGLSNILVSTPVTTTGDHLVATLVGCIGYVAGWRYWVLSIRESASFIGHAQAETSAPGSASRTEQVTEGQ